ncbi:MAG TPA: hypothetical protein ENI08_00545 [Candidatus Dependentiae bacterium]|nr:hypothetical protein [Candidatus Dependentiae bacterium]
MGLMPGYKGHLIGGVAAFGITLLVSTKIFALDYSLVMAAEWLICALAGSLFPDIDVKSKGQKYFYWVVLALFIFCILWQKYKLLAGCSVIVVMPMLVRHRGIFHRLWFVILVPLAIWFFVSFYVPYIQQRMLLDTIFFIAGAISHLWLDLGIRRMLRL